MGTRCQQVLLRHEVIYEVQIVKQESERTWGLRPVPHLPLLRAGLPQVANPEVGRLQERWALLTWARTPVVRHRSYDIVSLPVWHWWFILERVRRPWRLSVDLIVPWCRWWYVVTVRVAAIPSTHVASIGADFWKWLRGRDLKFVAEINAFWWHFDAVLSPTEMHNYRPTSIYILLGGSGLQSNLVLYIVHWLTQSEPYDHEYESTTII